MPSSNIFLQCVKPEASALRKPEPSYYASVGKSSSNIGIVKVENI